MTPREYWFFLLGAESILLRRKEATYTMMCITCQNAGMAVPSVPEFTEMIDEVNKTNIKVVKTTSKATQGVS